MVETKSLKALSVLAQASCKITQGEFLQMQISINQIQNYLTILMLLEEKQLNCLVHLLNQEQ